MHPSILLCFALSGISGLVLEIVWTRMLEHVFGATTLAISTVLTCFMGGLALGSYLFGRLADRLRSPLMAYAAAEGMVGVSAFLIPVLIERVYPDLNRWMFANLSNSFWLLSTIRFAAVAVVLLVPTTCMGATLPLLSRYAVEHEGHMARVGSRVGWLYTLNTIGAVTGVFLTTFILLPWVGLSSTNKIAGSLNLGICVFVVAAMRRIAAIVRPSVEEVRTILDIDIAAEGVRTFVSTRAQRFAAMTAFFLSGLASMNLQVVWNRAMAMTIGSSVYSFSIVLIAFLVGLAFGSAVFNRASKRLANPVLALAFVEFGVAAAVICNYLYMEDLPRVFATMVTSQVSSYANNVGFIQFLMFAVASLAVLPATFFMGATFPLTVSIVSGGLDRVGRDVGGAYALNTMGAIVGSFFSAFVFIPLFSHYFGGVGMQITFFVSVCIYVAIGVALVLVSRISVLSRIAVSIPCCAATAAFAFGAPAWDPAALTIGVFRLSLMKHAMDEESWGDPDVKYYYDGVSTTVSVELWGRHFALKNNGKVDASNGDDMPTQIMVAAYPLLLHSKGPERLDAAIVGFGSGVTVGAALQFPVRSVDAVELENAVVEGSRIFGSMEGESVDQEFDVNHLVYRSPVDRKTGKANPRYDWKDPNTYVVNDRFKIANDDGRNFLSASSKKYDVIISEPSNPWITGVSNMFTVDSFASMSKALAKDGIFCQWVQLYEMSPENIKTILRTFAEVFPYVALFSAEDLSSDTMLLGSFSPIEFDVAKVERAMQNQTVKSELERAYIFSPTDVFARVLLVDRKELLDYANGPESLVQSKMPVNTDDNALIEFAAPRDLISYSRFAGYLSTIYSNKWKYGRLSGALKWMGERNVGVNVMVDQAISLLKNGRKEEADSFIEKARSIAPDDPKVLAAVETAKLLGGKEGRPEPEIEDVTAGPGLTEQQLVELKSAVGDVRKSLDARSYGEAIKRFDKIPEQMRRNGGPQMMLLNGYLRYLISYPEDPDGCDESIDIFSQLVRENEAYASRHPEMYFYLAMCHDNALHFDKAVNNMRIYIDLAVERDERERIVQAKAKADLAAALLGIKGTMLIDLPPDAPGSPTTDEQGEAPKVTHLN